MKVFYFLFLLNSFLISLPASALWEKWEKNGSLYKKEFSDPSFSTLWGGLRRALHWPKHKGRMTHLLPKGFKEKIPVYIYATESKNDLYIFYLGVFGKPDGKTGPHAIDSLEKLGGHVIVIPNILADTYINARPDSGLQDLEQERDFQTNLFDEVVNQVGKEKISKIHVLAESLGTFQALQVKRKFDSLKILAPPLYLDRSIKRFDDLILRQSKVLQNCTIWWKWPYMAYKIKSGPLPVELSNEDKSCFGSWVIADGFVMSIKKTADKIKIKKSGDKIPENFTQFVEIILPGFASPLKNKDERLSLNYLLKRIETPIEKIEIISAKDDFLNELSEWDELKKNYPSLRKNIYLFSWGGHSGPFALDGFLTDLYKK
jgi:hypothetical protein